MIFLAQAVFDRFAKPIRQAGSAGASEILVTDGRFESAGGRFTPPN
jgi:hypothetical protein